MTLASVYRIACRSVVTREPETGILVKDSGRSVTLEKCVKSREREREKEPRKTISGQV